VPTGRARRDNELGAPRATGAAATSQHPQQQHELEKQEEIGGAAG